MKMLSLSVTVENEDDAQFVGGELANLAVKLYGTGISVSLYISEVDEDEDDVAIGGTE